MPDLSNLDAPVFPAQTNGPNVNSCEVVNRELYPKRLPVSDFLSDWMQKHKITGKALAKILDTAETSVTNYKNGIRRIDTVFFLERLSGATKKHLISSVAYRDLLVHFESLRVRMSKKTLQPADDLQQIEDQLLSRIRAGKDPLQCLTRAYRRARGQAQYWAVQMELGWRLPDDLDLDSIEDRWSRIEEICEKMSDLHTGDWDERKYDSRHQAIIRSKLDSMQEAKTLFVRALTEVQFVVDHQDQGQFGEG